MAQLKTQSEGRNCPICGGNLKAGTYDHVIGAEHLEHVSGEIRWTQHIIRDVPALICASCGSPWIRPEDGVLETLQAYMRTCVDQGVFVSNVQYLSISPTIH
jgi:hypothetical protein